MALPSPHSSISTLLCPREGLTLDCSFHQRCPHPLALDGFSPQGPQDPQKVKEMDLGFIL